MSAALDRTDCIDEAARLLPWYLNGTLADADARHVAAHLEQCAVCRADAAGQGRVRALLRIPDPVVHSPHAGLGKLMQRIDETESAHAVPRDAPAPQAWRAGRGTVRWLAAAVVLQSVALAIVGGAVLFGGPGADDGAKFRTLTAPSSAPPGAALRVAVAPTTTLAELQDLMHAHGLIVLAGPSEAGLFTLAFDSARSTEADAGERSAVLARLRADPRVRFAEPLGPGEVAR